MEHEFIMTIGDTTYIRRFFSLYSNEEKDKVRGHALYPTDYLSAMLPENVGYVGVIRSPHRTASFSKIETAAAEKIEGVLKIITVKDVPHNRPFGSGKKAKSQLILADKQVRYVGEPVALVVADSVETLALAMQAVKIDWKPSDKAVREVVFEERLKSGKMPAGDVIEVVAPFHFPTLQTRYLEAESGWVAYEAGKMEFHIGALLSESQRVWVSEVLGVDLDDISARESPLGGQFGGRQQRELIVFLALAASIVKRSVCLRFLPKEQDIGSYGYDGSLSLLVDRATKKTVGLKGHITLDAGSYEGSSQATLQKTLEHAVSIYDFKAVDISGEVVITNTHPRRALKGEGLTAITWVTEQLMEKAAKQLEISPLEFRQLNIGTHCEMGSKVLSEVEKLERPFKLLQIDRNRPVWAEKEIIGRGFGFQYFHPTFLKEFDHSEVSIDLLASGTFVIRTSNLTLDLHLKGALSEVAATVLKTHPKAFTVEGKMRPGFEKAARRETYPEFYYLAQATWHAAADLKKKIIGAAEKKLNSDDIVLQDGAVVDQKANRKMGYRELAFTHGHNDLKSSFTLKDVEKPHGCSAGAIARVAFHPLTGELRVESVKVVLDAGPVLYARGLEVQLDASASWAIAALFSSDGSEEQPIPTTIDEPQEVSLVTIDYPLKDYSEKAPQYFGSRGVTAVMMSTVLASLVNAIADAKEMSLDTIPMSLEFMYPKKKMNQVHTIPFRRS